MAFYKDREREREVRVNNRIKVPQVRLIDDKGEQKGVVSTFDALRMAREVGLDLVEISPNSNPPVCKILDYGKYKYDIKKKAHEAKRKQTVIKVKEVKMRPATDDHDIEFKVNHIKRFLEEGDKVKVTVVFKGREMVYQERGKAVLERVLNEVKDKAKIEQTPNMEGKSMFMLLGPV
ncbi:MAG: translation initiation factor IF-3 [Deltaproteobacteria bacterium]|nr:MAG: translation initiation factor IF-3 [Deltaproteobacteria bacterium]